MSSYTYMYKDKETEFFVDEDTQIAIYLHKGEKWIDSHWHEIAWQLLSPIAFKLYDKFERQPNNYMWVYNIDQLGVPTDAVNDAITELEKKGFLESVTKVVEETGEVITCPCVYHFYERVQL